MSIQSIHTATQTAADLPLLALLTDTNTAQTLAALPDVLQALSPDETGTLHEDGTLTPLFGKTAKGYLLGIGAAEKLTVEKLRRGLHTALTKALGHKWTTVQIVWVGHGGLADAPLYAEALGEIPVLGSYQFLHYLTGEKKKPHALETVTVVTDIANAEACIQAGQHTAQATCIARDLVNEPPNVLTAPELAHRAQSLGKKYGFGVEVLEKTKLESLKMGGLLAVNRGSLTPPTFSILEWKPANARNAKPVVLVGKGVVFDTGGLSLKPTAGGMDSMKCDMAGAAAVVGAMCAVAANELPVHVIGLIPATDNRPGQDAYTPNDVVTMYDGSTVEVLNTDAEGRMILADALHFAKQYQPELVIDLATLTGAAVIAIGSLGTAMMRTASDETANALQEAGHRMHERLVELPLWEEYGEMIKSPIADRKNIGGREAGAITAGKFLQQFTDYPWVHLDIAGPAYLEGAADSYRGKYGTGVGVRLLTDFLRHYGA
jgi:leucyl aminopeptidase